MAPHCSSASEGGFLWHAFALPCALAEAHFAGSPRGAGAVLRGGRVAGMTRSAAALGVRRGMSEAAAQAFARGALEGRAFAAGTVDALLALAATSLADAGGDIRALWDAEGDVLVAAVRARVGKAVKAPETGVHFEEGCGAELSEAIQKALPGTDPQEARRLSEAAAHFRFSDDWSLSLPLLGEGSPEAIRAAAERLADALDARLRREGALCGEALLTVAGERPLSLRIDAERERAVRGPGLTLRGAVRSALAEAALPGGAKRIALRVLSKTGEERSEALTPLERLLASRIGRGRVFRLGGQRRQAAAPSGWPMLPTEVLKKPLPLHCEHGLPQWRGALTVVAGPLPCPEEHGRFFVARSGDGRLLWLRQDAQDRGWELRGFFA
jgi:hypothetical protein